MVARHSDKGSGRLTRATEQQLIADAREGCEASARALVDSHQDRLAAFVWRIVRDRDETEEICQEAFLRAFHSLDTFSSEYRFSTWLFTIGYRLCLNHIRRRRPMTGELDVSALRSSEPDAFLVLAESEEARRLKDRIWEAVDRLSPPQRAAVVLFYREGMNCEQIAQTLEMPMATVKSHLHRARGRLRDALAGLVKDWTEVQSLRDIAS